MESQQPGAAKANFGTPWAAGRRSSRRAAKAARRSGFAGRHLDHPISLWSIMRSLLNMHCGATPMVNRFERVDEVQPDAITLSLSRSGTGEVGSVIFPASASGGRFSEDKISGELPAVDSFRSAVKLANEMKVAVVVLDPEDVWKKDWGELYRPVAD
jgi:hypothetical protein